MWFLISVVASSRSTHRCQIPPYEFANHEHDVEYEHDTVMQRRRDDSSDGKCGRV